MLLYQLTESLNKIILPDKLYDRVYSIHREPNDFLEGDIAKRIYDYEYYELKIIPINKIDLDEWQIDYELIEEYKKIMKSKRLYPPIIVGSDYSIIDGIHRANALYELGINKIKAYVGVKKSSFNPYEEI